VGKPLTSFSLVQVSGTPAASSPVSSSFYLTAAVPNSDPAGSVSR
jgi:hypothetical protein